MKKYVTAGVFLILVATIGVAVIANAGGGATEGFASQTATLQFPKEKQTTLGLYVTAKEAYEKWKAEPDKMKIIDVRTPEEYLFVGHPTMAWKIPVAAQTYEWDAEKKQFPMKPLPDFVARVRRWPSPTTRSWSCAGPAAAAPWPSTRSPRPGSSTFTTSSMAWRGMRSRIPTASLWASG